ncbi:hypothetical protein NM688_g8773 [Phlebia brevispora]|uniref:Uncharacterized protein n=1 Tax=Phlebia brevispora TaxID=194682 RepID=A0ACC1RQQ5_9APHY|nr:hypothetical protein NM688_g8773 [Phlebia brevispora]
MPSESTRTLKIVIVGGGVCGLACAIALNKQGLEVDIYEAAAKFGEIGAGIGIGGNTIAILKALGVYEDVLARGDGVNPERAQVGWVRFRYGADDHALVWDHSIGIGEKTFGVHRASFLDALVGHFDQTRAHFNKRCTAVIPLKSNPSRYEVTFADGTSVEADIVIGADGIKSTVRGAVTGKDPLENFSFSNTVAYRALVPTSAVKSAGTKIDYTEAGFLFLGKNKHVTTYPIRSGSLINIVAFVTDRTLPMGQATLPPGAPQVVPATTEELVAEYMDFGEDVRKLLSCVPNASRWNMFVVHPFLDSFVKGRVVLVGDSAHAMPVHLGAGAGQGLEDAYLLARLIGHPQTTADNLEDVLKIYDEVRRTRTQHIWHGSMRAGDIYEGAAEYGFSHDEMAKELRYWWDEVIGNHKLDGDTETAVGRLQERGIFAVE